MKTMFRIGALALSCLLFSCEKEKGEEPGGPASSSGDYFPSTADSEWHMSSTSLGDYTLYSLGSDSTINGKKYYKFNHSAGARQYVNKEDGVYTAYTYVPVIGKSITMIVLKDAPVGTTWTNTITSGGIPMEYKYKVLSRDLDKTVNGKVFNNVIAIEYELSMKEPTTGVSMSLGKGRQYYAKGVGGIAGAFEMGMMGNTITDSTYIKSYTIK